MLLYENHQQRVASVLKKEVKLIENRTFFVNQYEISIGESVGTTVKSLYLDMVLRQPHRIVLLLLCNLHLTEDVMTATSDMGFRSFNTVWITRKGQFASHVQELYHLGFSYVDGYRSIEKIQNKDELLTCRMNDIIQKRYTFFHRHKKLVYKKNRNESF